MMRVSLPLTLPVDNNAPRDSNFVPWDKLDAYPPLRRVAEPSLVERPLHVVRLRAPDGPLRPFANPNQPACPG